MFACACFISLVRSSISSFRDRTTIVSLSSSTNASRRRASSLTNAFSCSRSKLLRSLSSSNRSMTLSSSALTFSSSTCQELLFSSAERITSSTPVRSDCPCSLPFKAAALRSSRIASFWLSLWCWSRSSRSSSINVFTLMRCSSIWSRKVLLSPCSCSIVLRADWRSNSAEFNCSLMTFASLSALYQWNPYHSRKFCFKDSCTVLYSITRAACFSRLRTRGFSSAMISSTLSRFLSVALSRLKASSFLLWYKPIPAASSKSLLRSSGLIESAVSTKPCPIIVYVRSLRPVFPSSSLKSLSLTLWLLIRYSFLPSRYARRVRTTSE